MPAVPKPPVDPWLGDWYIVCPAFDHAVGSGGNYRCTEVLLVQATSEEEAAKKALIDTEEAWFACVVIRAAAFKAPEVA
jgi:hypothetical protein